MRKQLSLAYYAAGGLEIPSLSAGIVKFTEGGGKIEVFAKTATQLFDDRQIQAFAARCMDADIIIISLHGGRESCPAFDAIEKEMADRREEGKPCPGSTFSPQAGMRMPWKRPGNFPPVSAPRPGTLSAGIFARAVPSILPASCATWSQNSTVCRGSPPSLLSCLMREFTIPIWRNSRIRGLS